MVSVIILNLKYTQVILSLRPIKENNINLYNTLEYSIGMMGQIAFLVILSDGRFGRVHHGLNGVFYLDLE